MTVTQSPYGAAYGQEQAAKYRNRDNNHWRHRLALADRLVRQFVLPRYPGATPGSLTVVDVGCSIGTFAIEFAKGGYRSFGIDSDPESLEIARSLSAEEGVKPEFVHGNIADWDPSFPPIDIAICFDIFEHLHDDELGSFLQAIRKSLSERGALVFHTYPLQYDYLFYYRRAFRLPLALFRWLPPAAFRNLTRAYAALIDALMLAALGRDHKDHVSAAAHCNLTTRERLRAVLVRAGYEIVHLESTQLFHEFPELERAFAHQPVAHRNLYGVAVPRDGARPA